MHRVTVLMMFLGLVFVSWYEVLTPFEKEDIVEALTLDYERTTGSGYGGMGGDLAIGDVDNDGNLDVAAGAIYYNTLTYTNVGAVFLYSASSIGGPVLPDIITPDDQNNEYFGYSISMGDVNGDGYDDLLAGAYRYDTSNADAGRALLYYGSAIGLSPTYQWSSSGDDQANAEFGTEVVIGDVNGDGYGDVIVSAPYYDSPTYTNCGKVYVYYGSRWGPPISSNWTYEGHTTNHYAGRSLAVGDYDGDGYGDLAIAMSNTIYIFRGGTGGLSTTYSWYFYFPSHVYEVILADVNNDGFSDVVAGLHYASGGYTSRGRVDVYLGGKNPGSYSTPDWSKEGEPQSYAYFGFSLGSGDFNGDGFMDIVVGAYQYDTTLTDAGKVYAFLGNKTSLEDTAEWSFTGGTAYEYFGQGLAPIYFDINGDDIDDLIVGAPRYSSGNGTLYRFYGTFVSTSVAWSSRGPAQTGAYFGYSLAKGDFDGDGCMDLAVGAPFYDGTNTQEGRVLVYRGTSSGLSTTASWFAPGPSQNGAHLGSALAAGDFNGDGYDDLAVGAPDYDTSNANAGLVRVHYGSSSGLSSTPGFSTSGPDQAYAYFGYALAAGDINGDGYDDLLVGSPYYDTFLYTDGGRVDLYLGTPWGLTSSSSWYSEGGEMRANYGSAIATGDIDADGDSDFAVGAPLADGGGTDRGKIFIYTDLSTDPITRTGTVDREQLGNSLTFGDFDGDGYDDLAAGALMYSEGGTFYGRVRVFHHGTSLRLQIINRDSRMYAAYSGLSAGDIDGDGRDDLLVGAPLDDYPTYSRSAIYVHRGSMDMTLEPYSWRYRKGYNMLGYAVLCGDFNGDSLGDMVAGAPANNSNEGAVYVWYGEDTSRLDPPMSMYIQQPYEEEGTLLLNIYPYNIWSNYVPPDLEGVEIYYSTSMRGPWTLYGRVAYTGENQIVAKVTGLTDGQEYFFRVRSYDEVPNYSEYIYGSGTPLDGKAPNPPTTFEARLTQQGYIRLNWTLSNSTDVQGYIIVRNDNVRYITLNTTQEYVDMNVTLGQIYTYELYVFDEVPNYAKYPENLVILADTDYDGDGVGDLQDRDDDGDGVEDLRDAFPYNSSEWADYDGDGVGDNADTDDDNDGVPDTSDPWPLLDLNDIEATVDSVEQKIDNLNMTVEEILQRVKDLQNDMNYLNISSAAVLGEILVRLSRLEANLTAKLVTIERNLTTKIDGMNRTLRSEISSALTQIMSRINSMDLSLRALIQSFWLDYNVTEASQTDQIITRIGNMEVSIRALIEDFWDDYNSTSSSDTARIIQKIEEEWSGLNGSIEYARSYLSDRINYTLDVLRTRIAELESEMEDNVTALREYIGLTSLQLRLYMEVVNTTLHAHLTQIEEMIGEFRDATLENLTAISNYLHEMWQNNTEAREEILSAIESTNDLIRTLNDASMSELRARLDDLREYLIGFNTTESLRLAGAVEDLMGRLDELNESAGERFDHLDTTLQALAKLDTIIDDLSEVDQSIDVKSGELKDENKTVQNYNLILLILLIIVIVLEVLILLRKGGGGEVKVVEKEVVRERAPSKGGEEEVEEEGDEVWEEEELEEVP